MSAVAIKSVKNVKTPDKIAFMEKHKGKKVQVIIQKTKSGKNYKIWAYVEVVGDRWKFPTWESVCWFSPRVNPHALGKFLPRREVSELKEKAIMATLDVLESVVEAFREYKISYTISAQYD